MDSSHTGSWNMAADEALLQACISGKAPPTLRIYSWSPPAVSLGRFQRLEKAVNLEACRAQNIEIARRPTGGRAILHDREITFSVIAPLAALGTQGVMDTYRQLSAGILAALQSLGINAQLIDRASQTGQASRAINYRAAMPAPAEAPTSAPQPAAPQTGMPVAACFAVKARCDLMVGGRKIVGSAQVHREGCVLQQNSLPFVIEADKWAHFFRGMEGVTAQAVGLWEAAAREVPHAEIADALQKGFARALGIGFTSGDLTPAELARVRELQPKCNLLATKQ